MSLQGSWCDAIIVQAVADSQNLKIHIVESNENFSDTTLIEPAHLLQQPPTTIYLGHVNEEHYVSTVPYMCSSSSLESQHIDILNKIEQKVVSEESHNVNVVAEVSNTVNVLPRLPSDTGTIKVNLKRKLQYKSSAMSFNVRPHKVIQAANWLINNSSLYRQEGITVNQVWGVEYRDYCLVDERNIENEHKGLQNIVNCCVNTASNTNCDEVVETEDQWSEDEVEIPAGVTDTMLTNTNFVEDNESQRILNVAPGEGNKPSSIFRDQYSEELAYPSIFLGQK